MSSNITYKFNEVKYINEVKNHIDSTYTQHYSHGNVQATDLIAASGNGKGFCIGNIIKYASRFGKKEGENRKDIIKIIHYCIILLSIIDKK
tara:strand:+ start:1856 stop:2128 length:273 start_codon:yes stop_codon:yes gene_type:complete